jgi:hypothetical protein
MLPREDWRILRSSVRQTPKKFELLQKRLRDLRTMNDKRIFVVAEFCIGAEVIRASNYDMGVDNDDLVVQVSALNVKGKRDLT